MTGYGKKVPKQSFGTVSDYAREIEEEEAWRLRLKEHEQEQDDMYFNPPYKN